MPTTSSTLHANAASFQPKKKTEDKDISPTIVKKTFTSSLQRAIQKEKQEKQQPAEKEVMRTSLPMERNAGTDVSKKSTNGEGTKKRVSSLQSSLAASLKKSGIESAAVKSLSANTPSKSLSAATRTLNKPAAKPMKSKPAVDDSIKSSPPAVPIKASILAAKPIEKSSEVELTISVDVKKRSSSGLQKNIDNATVKKDKSLSKTVHAVVETPKEIKVEEKEVPKKMLLRDRIRLDAQARGDKGGRSTSLENKFAATSLHGKRGSKGYQKEISKPQSRREEPVSARPSILMKLGPAINVPVSSPSQDKNRRGSTDIVSAKKDDARQRTYSEETKSCSHKTVDGVVKRSSVPLKSSLLSSLSKSKKASEKTQKACAKSKAIDLKRTKKIIYTIAQLMAFNDGVKRFSETLPDMRTMLAPTKVEGNKSSDFRRGQSFKAESGHRHQESSQQRNGPRGQSSRGTDRQQYGTDRGGQSRGNDRHHGGGQHGGRGGGHRDGRGGGRGGRGNQSSRHSRNAPDVLSTGPVKPLDMSETRWKPTLNTVSTNAKDEVLKEVKSILNKMTRERFTTLSARLVAIEMSSLEIISVVITRILTKALEEPSFADVYADLCKVLHHAKSKTWDFLKIVYDVKKKEYYCVALPIPASSVIVGPFTSRPTSVQEITSSTAILSNFVVTEKRIKEETILEEDTLLYSFQRPSQPSLFYALLKPKKELTDYEPLLGPYTSGKEALAKMTASTSMKRLLLNAMQTEFNKENRHDDMIASDITFMSLSLDDQKRKTALYQKRGKALWLGAIRFIGELFKNDMLPENAVRRCVLKLLGLQLVKLPTGKTAAQTVKDPDEDDIEALSKLLFTVGKLLDTNKNRDMMDAVIIRIVELTKNDRYSSRTRFMLQDVVELRDFRWQPRHAEMTQQTLQQVRQEAEKLQRMGKNAQHATVSTVRKKTATLSSQLVKNRKDLLLPAAQVEEAEEEAEGLVPVVDEKAVQKIKSILTEYISILDMNEALKCISELPKELYASVVENTFYMAMEGKERVRPPLADFLVGAYTASILMSLDFQNGITLACEFLQDMKIDIPKIQEHVGFLLGRLMVVECFDLEWISTLLAPCKETGLSELVLENVFRTIFEENRATFSHIVKDVSFAAFLSTEKAKDATAAWTAFQERNADLFEPTEDEENVQDSEDEEDILYFHVQSILKEYLHDHQDAKILCRALQKVEEEEGDIGRLCIEVFLYYGVEECNEDGELGILSELFPLLLEKKLVSATEIQEGLHEGFSDLGKYIELPTLHKKVAWLVTPLFQIASLDLQWLQDIVEGKHLP